MLIKLAEKCIAQLIQGTLLVPSIRRELRVQHMILFKKEEHLHVSSFLNLACTINKMRRLKLSR